MTKSEIQHKFDEIVDFSGVEEFLDTPVKRYSSGMYVRLAFSVAAHLQSEILLVDEVLAVGDAEFQQKCIAKMSEATKAQHRTVLFVSHNMSIARSLCQNGIFLSHGKIRKTGNINEVTDHYLETMSEASANMHIGARSDREGTAEARIEKMVIRHPSSENEGILISGEPAEVFVTISSSTSQAITDLVLELNIFNESSNFLTTLSNKFVGTSFGAVKSGQTFKCTINRLPLMAGHFYFRTKLLVNGFPADIVDRALNFEVLVGDYYHSGSFKLRATPGVYIEQSWETNP